VRFSEKEGHNNQKTKEKKRHKCLFPDLFSFNTVALEKSAFLVVDVFIFISLSFHFKYWKESEGTLKGWKFLTKPFLLLSPLFPLHPTHR
jgi:hypothetical protein